MTSAVEDEKPGSVTQLLNAWEVGEALAENRLMDEVYDDLRRIAANQLRKRPRRKQETTELVNEAYLRLQQQNRVHWKCRKQFFSVAARIIRRVIVDTERHHAAARRDQAQDVPLDTIHARCPRDFPRWHAFCDALDRLAVEQPDAAKVIEYKYFIGLKGKEIAELMEISEGRVSQLWNEGKMALRTMA